MSQKTLKEKSMDSKEIQRNFGEYIHIWEKKNLSFRIIEITDHN